MKYFKFDYLNSDSVYSVFSEIAKRESEGKETGVNDLMTKFKLKRKDVHGRLYALLNAGIITAVPIPESPNIKKYCINLKGLEKAYLKYKASKEKPTPCIRNFKDLFDQSGWKK